MSIPSYLHGDAQGAGCTPRRWHAASPVHPHLAELAGAGPAGRPHAARVRAESQATSKGPGRTPRQPGQQGARPVRGPRAAPLRAVRRGPALTGEARPLTPPPPRVRRAAYMCSQQQAFPTGGQDAAVGTVGDFHFPANWYYVGPHASADGRYADSIFYYGSGAGTFTVPGDANGVRLCAIAAAGCAAPHPPSTGSLPTQPAWPDALRHSFPFLHRYITLTGGSHHLISQAGWNRCYLSFYLCIYQPGWREHMSSQICFM